MGGLDHAPRWLLHDTLLTEMEAYWRVTYTEIPASTTSQAPNVISAHVSFKIKDDYNGMLKLKERLILNCNRDKYHLVLAGTLLLQTS